MAELHALEMWLRSASAVYQDVYVSYIHTHTHTLRTLEPRNNYTDQQMILRYLLFQVTPPPVIKLHFPAPRKLLVQLKLTVNCIALHKNILQRKVFVLTYYECTFIYWQWIKKQVTKYANRYNKYHFLLIKIQIINYKGVQTILKYLLFQVTSSPVIKLRFPTPRKLLVQLKLTVNCIALNKNILQRKVFFNILKINT